MHKLVLLLFLVSVPLVNSWRTKEIPEDFKGLDYPCDDYDRPCKSWSENGWCTKSRFVWKRCGASCKSCENQYVCKDGRSMSMKSLCPEFDEIQELPIQSNSQNWTEHGHCNPIFFDQIVMNGVPNAPYAESKWHVTLLIMNKPTRASLDSLSKCSGSLINENTVLTSAHCLKNAKSEGWSVYAGFQGESQIVDGESRTVAAFVIPSSYPERISWDLALVFLTEPFKLTDKISPISIMKPEDITVKNSEWGNCQFSGTGQIITEDGKSCKDPNKKMYGRGLLIGRDCCEAVRPLFNNEYDSNVPYPIDVGCFRGAHQMSCSGDSGAGVTCSRNPASTDSDISKHVLLGIHRGGAPCCIKDKETQLQKVVNQPVEKVIIRLDKRRIKWIQNEIENYTLPKEEAVPAPQ